MKLLRLNEAGILDHFRETAPNIGYNILARRLPQPPRPAKYEEQIQKTIERAKIEGKAQNTLINFSTDSEN
jgi:hypothetical protein